MPPSNAGLRKRLAAATLSNATQPSPAAPPTSSLNYGSHCAVRCVRGGGGQQGQLRDRLYLMCLMRWCEAGGSLLTCHNSRLPPACCSMALGFLFMGAGTLTFGTSPQEVAALVVSLFPRMPASTTDHRCHLQVGRDWPPVVCMHWAQLPEALALKPLRLTPQTARLPTDLQAFRHLYVLATQPRSVDAIDVDTKQVGRSAC